MIKRFFLATILLIFSNFAFANEDIKVPDLIGRAMFEGSLQPTEAQKENLNAALRNLEAENKVQMGVLIVDTVKPYSIEEYSIKVAEKWKIGKKGVDNGVLMVVATEDHKARIEVGDGLQGSLTDAMSKRIQVEKMVPEFKKGQFINGIIATVEGIKEVTAKEEPVITQAIEVRKSQEASESMSLGTVFLLIFGGISLVGGLITYIVVRKSKTEKKRKQAAMDVYNQRQTAYSSSVKNYGTSTHYNSKKSQTKSYSTSNSNNKKSTNFSSSTNLSNDDINKNKSNDSVFTPSSSSTSDSGISNGGSFSGGGSTTDW